jgi:gamma-glutamyltranspeptidase/glutathione hydrolase
MYVDAQGNLIPGASRSGHRAVAVPGTVAGLELALKKYGSLARAAVIAPAIALAESGYVLEPGDVEMLGVATSAFRADAASSAIFLNRGETYKAGERLVQHDLARTLRNVSEKGADGFYRGPVAQAIATSSAKGGGLITLEDLAQYQAKERAPIECDYRGVHIISAPPPSSGGVVVCEILNVLEGYPLRDMGFRSARAVHVQIEAMRRAFTDRNRYLGDPDFVSNPVERLLDKNYAAQLRMEIDPAKAGVSASTTLPEGSNTTHYSIADSAGNAVAVTYTLNDWFGAKVTAAGTGVLLNDEMDDFTSKIGQANLYGLVQGEPNVIAPGKRPLSSMSPTIVTRDGKPLLVLGTPGGSRIPTAVVHTLINVIDYGMNIQEAVDAPRFHQQGQPEATAVEAYALSPDTRDILVAMGHSFGGRPPSSHMAVIMINPAAGSATSNTRFLGANDPRRHTGLALGF